MRIIFILSFCLVFFGTLAQAEVREDPRSAYRQIVSEFTTSTVVPTLVKVEVPELSVSRGKYLVYEVNTNQYVPYELQTTYLNPPIGIDAVVNSVVEMGLSDSNWETGAEFFPGPDSHTETVIHLMIKEPIEANSLTFWLDRYVALPNQIKLEADINGQWQKVFSSNQVNDETIYFPAVTSRAWTLSLVHDQPLRIKEITFAETKNTPESVVTTLQFLTQPNTSYQIFADPDRSVSVPTLESINQRGEKSEVTIGKQTARANQLYIESDQDHDLIIDRLDNCPSQHNADQLDINQNRIGDVCEDFDRDGVMNVVDNCPNLTNGWQDDTDGDGLGDVCDGEESRFTEKHSWIPWVGIGLAGLVLIILFVMVAKGGRRSDIKVQQKSE